MRTESSIQRAVVTYAKAHGCLAKKLSTQGFMGNVGWPDYMFLNQGKILFIEFKRPGGVPTALQESVIDSLRAQMFVARVIDDVEQGKKLIDSIL